MGRIKQAVANANAAVSNGIQAGSSGWEDGLQPKAELLLLVASWGLRGVLLGLGLRVPLDSARQLRSSQYMASLVYRGTRKGKACIQHQKRAGRDPVAGSPGHCRSPERCGDRSLHTFIGDFGN